MACHQAAADALSASPRSSAQTIVWRWACSTCLKKMHVILFYFQIFYLCFCVFSWLLVSQLSWHERTDIHESWHGRISTLAAACIALAHAYATMCVQHKMGNPSHTTGHDREPTNSLTDCGSARVGQQANLFCRSGGRTKEWRLRQGKRRCCQRLAKRRNKKSVSVGIHVHGVR